MTRWVVVFLGVLSFVVGAGVRAGVEPVVRVEIEPETVSVGQAARLRVTLLVPTWFTKPPVYPLFEQVNALTRLPPDSSFPVSERVGAETWSGIVRDYQVYPQAAARYPFSGQVVILTYADPETQKPVEREVPVPPFSITATVPKGAESLQPFLASTSVELEQIVEGDTRSISPGAAVVRTVTASLVGMPAMFLPPMMSTAIVAGVSVYPKEPDLDEHTDTRDGRITSRRAESATYVFEQPGEFSLPAMNLRWWHTDKQVVETATVPAVVVTVAGGTASVGQEQSGLFSRENLYRLLVVVVLLAGAVLTVRRLGPGIRRRLNQWRCDRRASEAYAFRNLRQQLKQGDKRSVYRSLLVWVERAAPDAGPPVATGGAACGYDVEALARDAYGQQSASPNLSVLEQRDLEESLTALRRRLVGGRFRRRRQSALPALNP